MTHSVPTGRAEDGQTGRGHPAAVLSSRRHGGWTRGTRRYQCHRADRSRAGGVARTPGLLVATGYLVYRGRSGRAVELVFVQINHGAY